MIILDKDNFEQEVLNSEGLVLVDYWNEGCEPCKALMPDIEALSQAYGEKIKFCKLNTSSARRLAISQKVLGLPTITLYKGGAKIDEATKEAATKSGVQAMLDAALTAHAEEA
ncbi:thioredoxin TrxA [Acidaminobacter hydrogenoformans]|uniref:Thioredoxin n=1 Tax=Acidaminobacter hydrogenoformans DSM 2784 TaxID=1120920 RepID=A0A1G5S1I0_9FIRM|nr:thioredoxin domain-containing protein [Acidaminobacter hydrogenoformans]SCZ79987.1 thioredoxin 1 [Acidaminobacter hydrogenoformans DSM 2784]